MKMKQIFRLLLFIFALITTFKTISAQTYIPPNSPPFEYDPALSDSIECGYLFFSAFNPVSFSNYYPTNYILDQNGDILWYYPSNRKKLDFKIHPSGLISWFDFGWYWLMDSTFTIVDSVHCQKNRKPDSHELIIDDNGHYWVLCTRDTAMDLSSATTDFGIAGLANGTAELATIQELDQNGNLVKEWDSGPHFVPTDCQREYFTSRGFMDLVHPNSIDVDLSTGRVLLGSRNVSEVTCIDWASGNILWRLGGANNQFSFVNNDPGINSQHHARFQPLGISLFDNGNYHNPPFSRGVYYALNLNDMKASNLRQYGHPDQHSRAMGSAQMFPNGHALISWGLVSDTAIADDITFVNQDDSILFNIRIDGDYASYRVFCDDIPFEIHRPKITCEQTENAFILSVDGEYDRYQWSTGATTPSITATQKTNYQVFVPYGIGWVGSERWSVVDLENPCNLVSIEPELPQERKLIGMWDLLGRPVTHPQKGQLILKRFNDGSTEKIVIH